MSTIYDRAVRALQPVLDETGDGVDAADPLAYCCAPPCRHKTCAAVIALDDAGLLAYADLKLIEQRAEAIRTARDLLAYLEHGGDDLITIADWLLTGRCDAALAFADQNARNCAAAHGDRLSPDAATWIPPTTEDGA